MKIECSKFARDFIMDGMSHGDSVVLGDWRFAKHCDMRLILCEQVDCMAQPVEGTRTWVSFDDFKKAETTH